jgi:hypothetical protein
MLVPAVIEGAIHYLRSGEKSSRRGQGRCWNSASDTPAMQVCWPRLLNRISLKPGSHLHAAGNCTRICTAWASGDGRFRQCAARRAAQTSTFRNCCGPRLHTPTDDVIHPRITRDGTELVYNTPAPGSRCRCCASMASFWVQIERDASRRAADPAAPGFDGGARQIDRGDTGVERPRGWPRRRADRLAPRLRRSCSGTVGI